MLLASSRYSAADAERWAHLERQDSVYASTSRFERHVARSLDWLDGFVREGACYAGVSWGKDSTVLADMVQRVCPWVPLVWIRVHPISNPDCSIVRDWFLARYPSARYEEIETRCALGPDGHWHATGTLERGFAEAVDRFGTRYVSGVRAEESGPRKRRMMAYGPMSATTCAPIGWWKADDVFAYLYARALPVHPAYACGISGVWTRDRIRVASLGGRRGTGRGRADWEQTFYGLRRP